MMPTSPRLVVALLLIAAITLPAHAQDEDALDAFTVTTWSEKEGLPAGRIRAIAQDPYGYLWLGTDVGVVRFDGVRFVPWKAREGTGLPTSQVSALLSARDRSVWIGLADNGIVRIRDREFTTYGEANGFGRGFVFALAEDRHGTIWAGAFQGLFRFQGDRWERVGVAEGLREGSVLAVHEDRTGSLWIATPGAVLRRRKESARFEQIDAIEISNTSQHFSEDSSGTIWITDFQHGFRRAIESTGHTRPAGPRGWGAQLLHDTRGNLWVATLGQGLWRVRRDALDRPPTIETITRRDGLSSDAVQTLIEDREGNVWVGTRAGLQRLSPRRVSRVTDLPIPRALETSPDGSTWVGTADGLTRFSAEGRRHYSERDGLPGSVVLALHTDARGVLWVATERGLARFADGHFSPPVVPRGSGIERIFDITSSQDTIWFRDFYRGLFRLSGGALAATGDVLDAEGQRLQSLHADHHGNVWLGTTEGLLAVRRPDGRTQTYRLGIGEVRAIHEDSGGTLWVGGASGLARLSGDQSATLSRQHGFPGDVKSIADDKEGHLWLGLDAGIARLEKREVEAAITTPGYQVRYRLFSTADGVAGLPASLGSRSAVRDASGRLWFVTSAGVTIIDPQTLGPPPLPPPVRIESIVVDDRALDPAPGTVLPPRTSHLQVVFTSLTLTDPMRVRFRYRLDGFDRNWINAESSRQATYTNLPPGSYRFRVAASNNDGVWNDPGATWDFVIDPMFYETRRFIAVSATALGLMLWSAWWLRVRNVRRQFALVLAERVRMSRTIHDSLLQGLVALALQIDDLSRTVESSSPSIKDRVVRIRRHVEEYIREARHSIWELRSPRLDAQDLVAALREVGERAVADKPIRFDFAVHGVPRLFAREAEEQLLHIGQEALHNAIRHGSPSRLALELHYEETQLRVRISDDGCGFDLAAVHGDGGHFGLVSMQERAGQVGGTLTIASHPGRGTEVEARVPAA